MTASDFSGYKQQLLGIFYLPHDYNYKKIPKRCRKKWRGGLMETIKLFIIRPPQLQFFTDGIKITATKTKYYQVEN